MREKSKFPHGIREIEHIEIPMPDGCRLAARVWLPADAESSPVPAILEYLPYRKNDRTVKRDAPMQPYLAGHGYGVVRLDIRGSGDSEGLMPDEYLPQELQDGCDAIAWIAGQSWCDGNVGMIGISWGGFNALQIAALQPPALKAIVTLCSTDDRYADDVHYMGGCLLGEQLSWASNMFGRNTLPPDPRNVGERWREMWLQRLDGSGLWLKNWLEHQTRDQFWKHGSICEDWSRVRVPVYAVSGWADGYCRSVFRLMKNLQGPRKGLIGPWAHLYPHLGKPGPAIGFLQEELRWWNQWLKGKDTGIMDEPMLRIYMQDGVAPAGCYAERPGRWISEPEWPSSGIAYANYHLGEDGKMQSDHDPSPHGVLQVNPSARVGMLSGQWCSYAAPGDQPADQRQDDACSLCFETEPLASPLEIAGESLLELEFSVDRPSAQIAARLADVAPDGAATRVAFGVFNLTHRSGHESPQPLEPGTRYRVVIPIKPVAQRFEAAHRIRLALSTSYFPMVWPAPGPVTLTLYTAETRLRLPVRQDACADPVLKEFDAPESAPGPAIELLKPAESYRRIIDDLSANQVEMRIAKGDGAYKLQDIDLTVFNQCYESYRFNGDDLDTATGEVSWEHELSRQDWAIRTRTSTKLHADAHYFHIEARLQAWENAQLVFEREWNESIPRNHV